MATNKKELTPLQELEAEIRAIGCAVERIRGGSAITDDALIHLIQYACPCVGPRGREGGKKPPKKMIKAVLYGLENLEDALFGEGGSSVE